MLGQGGRREVSGRRALCKTWGRERDNKGREVREGEKERVRGIKREGGRDGIKMKEVRCV